MIFRIGKFYRHRNFLDVAFLVTKRQYQGPTCTKLKIFWYLNRKDGLIPMTASDVIRIPNDQKENFSEVIR